MARTRFTYACGCDGLTEGRNRYDADRRAKFLSAKACRDCDYRDQVARAAALAAQEGLPALLGTPRQIDYAQLRRREQLTALAEARTKVASVLSRCDMDLEAEIVDALAALEMDLRAESSAAAILDVGVGAYSLEAAVRMAGKRGLLPQTVARRPHLFER